MGRKQRHADGRWAKGNSGNPYGRNKRDLRAYIDKVLAEMVPDGSMCKSEALARMLVDRAMSGDHNFAAHLFDRIAPKPARIEVAAAVAVQQREVPSLPSDEDVVLEVARALGGLTLLPANVADGTPGQPVPVPVDEEITPLLDPLADAHPDSSHGWASGDPEDAEIVELKKPLTPAQLKMKWLTEEPESDEPARLDSWRN